MFWWCCGDFSTNMVGLFTGSNKKAPLEDGKEKGCRPAIDDDDRFASIFTYNSAEQYKALYKPNRYGAFDDDHSGPSSLSAMLDAEKQRERGTTDRLVEYAFTALSSTLFVLTLPFSLFFTVKFVGPSERLVVMRMGRTRGVYGQGTVLLLPLLDKAMTVDLRETAIELPPVHVVTADQGMLEVVAVACTKVNDPLTVCCALENREEIIHSLAYTALTRHLTKRMLTDVTNPTSLAKILTDCQNELNEFVRPHGVQVDRLIVNHLKVHKPAENAAVSVFQTILKSDMGKQLMGRVGAHFGMGATGQTGRESGTSTAGQEEGSAAASMRSLSTASTATLAAAHNGGEGKEEAAAMAPIISVDPELDALMARIRQCLGEPLVARVGRHFRILCKEVGSEFDIDLRSGRGWCGWTWERASSPPPDVHFTLDKPTLIALVDGSLSPMTAYLDGLVQIQGAIQDAIALRHLAEYVGNTN